MSINNATAADWDRLRKQLPAIEVSKPTIDESMMQVYLDAAEEERDAAAYSLDKAKWLECKAHWGKKDADWLNFDSSAYKFEEETEEDAKEEHNKYMRETDAADIADDYADEDVVNNPNHYNNGSIECIEGIQASMSAEAFSGYLKGNCMKYLWRYDYKGKPLEDLQKAQWYLAELIKELIFEEGEDAYNEEEHLGCLNFPFCDTEGCGGGE